MSDSIETHPLLSKLWDAEKNGAATGATARSFRTAWWRCEHGHAFERSPRAMVADPACPQCKLGPKKTSFADTRPQLAKRWHPEKNGALTPSAVDAAHAGSVWWRCAKGHDFERAPLLMTRDDSCPICALADKSLAVVAPAVAAEWHAEKNGAITPAHVDADHVMSAWWLCPNGHEYQATVRARARAHAGEVREARQPSLGKLRLVRHGAAEDGGRAGALVKGR